MEFFELKPKEKNSIRMENAGLAWRGYFSEGMEFTSDLPDRKEGLYFGIEHSKDHPEVVARTPLHGANQWPLRPSGFKEVVESHITSVSTLGSLLLNQIGLALGLENRYFEKRFTSDPTVLFRIFNYPKSENPTESWGVGEHTDMGFLTLLLQDSKGGLQVKLTDRTWIDAPPLEGSFIVNIGDMLELWTGGEYLATPHRVRNLSQQDRLSFPLFFDPGWHTTLEPLPLPLKSQNLKDKNTFNKRWDGLNLKALAGTMTYGEFVWKKVAHVFPHLVKG